MDPVKSTQHLCLVKDDLKSRSSLSKECPHLVMIPRAAPLYLKSCRVILHFFLQAVPLFVVFFTVRRFAAVMAERKINGTAKPNISKQTKGTVGASWDPAE